jgi:hypothetical protein
VGQLKSCDGDQQHAYLLVQLSQLLLQPLCLGSCCCTSTVETSISSIPAGSNSTIGAQQVDWEQAQLCMQAVRTLLAGTLHVHWH